MKHVAVSLLGIALNLTLSGPLLSKSETVKMTITGTDLQKSIHVTDSLILSKVDFWVGPGTSINGVPDTRDGFAMWSEGPISAPPKGSPQYEIWLYGRFPDERLMYVFTYQHDPSSKKGYVYLPGRGEKWYDVNVRTIQRGVEGHWFNASEPFERLIGSVIAAGRSAPAK